MPSSDVASLKARTERLISAGRAVLAVVSLVAIWLDPTEPVRYENVAYVLLAGYALYALALAVWTRRLGVVPRPQPLATHGLDLAFFCALQYFTDSASSPFFVYFIFALVAATLRWPPRGVLATGAGALVGFLSLSLLAKILGHVDEFELNRFIVRSSYLAVMTGLLAYLAHSQRRLRKEHAELAAWPRVVHGTAEVRLRTVLDQVAQIMAGDRVVLTWQAADEPGSYKAVYCRGTDAFDLSREARRTAALDVRAEFHGTSFLSTALSAGRPRTLCRRHGRISEREGTPLTPEALQRYNPRSVVAAPVESRAASGWLLALDTGRHISDDLVVMELVAREVAVALDQEYFLRSTEAAAATRERERLARDLHDGLMQSLTGIDLRLQHLKEKTAAESGHVPVIEELQGVIVKEHEELREFVRMFPNGYQSGAASIDLPRELGRIADRVRATCAVDIDVAGLPVLKPHVARGVYLLVREGIGNAIRHGAPSRVRVDVSENAEGLRITVTDDGRGFPVRGQYTDDELRAIGVGPRSIMERVRELGGHLTLDSSDFGARLDITLPRNGLTPP